MTRRIMSRLGAAAVIASLWVGLLAAPAAAAGTIRYVDDNAGATGPAACDTAGYTSIQAAIDASSAWDVVRVCPGTYWETLIVDVKGLTVQSWPRRTAKIVAPAAPAVAVEGLIGGDLVAITANKVRFEGFKINLPGGAFEPTASIVNGCSSYVTAVLVLGHSVRVADNFIDATGDYTLSGDCGYQYGIVFVGPEIAVSSYAPGTSRAAYNVVRDFKAGGVLVVNSAMAHVDHNSIRYLHADDPFSGPFTASGLSPRTGWAARQTGDPNGLLFGGFGIAVESGAYGDVHRNIVRGLFDPLAGPGGPAMLSGIWMLDAHDASKVRGNTVYGARTGITLGFPSISAASPTLTIPAGGYEVYNNTSTDNYVGIEVGSDANDIHHNRVRLNIGGLMVFEGANNTIWRNDARYNFDADCYDETVGGGSEGTANWWTQNLGNSNNPPDLCISTLQ